MTTLVVNGRGTMTTEVPFDQVEEGIASGMQWIKLEPSGVIVNLMHVVSIAP